MFGKHTLLVLIFFFVAIVSVKVDLQEYADVKKIIERFNSVDSEPANIFSVYFNEDFPGLDTRYQFFKDLNQNQENIIKFGEFPYHPIDSVNKEEYDSLIDKVQKKRDVILKHFTSIEEALKYLNDIFSRYQYMKPNDRKIQSATVYKYILGETVLPEESLPNRLPQLISIDCMSWLDNELQLLSFQYDNNDLSIPDEIKDYSLINLTQCLNYLTAGYSMVVSAYKAKGDTVKAKSYYDQYSNGIKELIDNHEASIKKMTFNSARRSAMYDDNNTSSAFTLSKVVSFIFVVSQFLIIILL